ncbi:CorA family divalent cation transporter [Vibrio coralliilyticus]|uniref:CorA family divalent cation transporter n=1 Tax=Vibrio coralliilyticus TaxID=190893 RepID=UPI00148D4185|nr:CorA family divalent cation transporter [Vibrio coralliilyticus]NOI31440.1 zinc transporter ZntB [Vibrio coralliilyticus]NOI50860.1 zinc transporter ZntB [Vibrio coralliilyticus]
MGDGLISGWRFDQGAPQPLTSLGETLAPAHWYHCQRDTPTLRVWLQSQSLPESLIASLLADDTRPRFETYGEDCFLFILRDINLNEGADPDDMLSVRLLWYRGALISTRKLPSRAVATVIEALQRHQGPSSVAELLVWMVSRINDAIAHFLTPVEEQIATFDVPQVSDLEPLNLLHTRLLRLRRYLKPQRYALEDLLHAQVPALSQQVHHFNNAQDTVARLNESIDFYLDQIAHALALVHQGQTQLMNRNTYLFSVIAGIFLPASFVTGLLGVNVGGLPGSAEPLAFWVLCALLIGVIGLEIVILKILRFI